MQTDLLVEGLTDEIFVRRCFRDLGIEVGTVFGKRGVNYVREKARGFAYRGQYSPILILADFVDLKATCAPEAARLLVPAPPVLTLVRLAVHEIESWLLASRSELATYFRIPLSMLPAAPDTVVDPKLALVNLARRSGKSRIRDMFVPRLGVSSIVGQGYVDGFSEFMEGHWDLESAQENSPSLARFVDRAKEVFLV